MLFQVFILRFYYFTRNYGQLSLSDIPSLSTANYCLILFSESTWSFFEKSRNHRKTAFQTARMRFLGCVTVYRNRIMWPKMAIFSLFFYILIFCIFSAFDCSEFGNLCVFGGFFLRFILLIVSNGHGYDIVIICLHPEDIHARCGASLG